MLGPLERPISEWYRGMFVDLSAFAAQVRQWCPASNILEVGCGEGAVAERLIAEFPGASFTGIDITPRVGRMFQGDATRVAFKQQAISEFARENPGTFDLLVMCDVLHHIPLALRAGVLRDAGKAVRSGGFAVLKDWERSATPIHMLSYLADRYITGDPIRYPTAVELHNLIERVFGADCVKANARIRPWENNIAFLVQL